MRRGPKFELTEDMILENLRTVAARLGTTVLSRRTYQQHGSFSYRSIQRKFGWAANVQKAGLEVGTKGLKPKPRRPCMQDCGRLSMTVGRHCRTCARRMRRMGAHESL